MTMTPARGDSTSAAPGSALTLPQYRHIIWLMPAAYLLHIVEEYVGDFPGWVTHDVKSSFDYLAFDLNNIAFMAILLTMVTLNSRRTTPALAFALAIFASANLFWDALFHLFMTLVLDHYSPGLVTAMLLYYPICILVGVVILKQQVLTRAQFLQALTAGLALFGLVVWYGLFHFAT